MHVFSGFSGLIIYGENIYKDYKRKKIYILLLFETKKKKTTKPRGEKDKQTKKSPKKCQ